MTGARSATCPQCGAPIDDAGRGAAVCRHCGTKVLVDRHWLGAEILRQSQATMRVPVTAYATIGFVVLSVATGSALLRWSASRRTTAPNVTQTNPTSMDVRTDHSDSILKGSPPVAPQFVIAPGTDPTIASRPSDFIGCASDYVKRGLLEQRAYALDVVVDREGHVDTVEILRGTTDHEMSSCIESATQKLQFRIPEQGPKRTTLALNFAKADEVPADVVPSAFASGATPPGAPQPVVWDDVPTENGRLPEGGVRRVVRASFPRIRACYEKGLQRTPGLHGRVVVSFVIDRTGAVPMSADGGSDLADAAVVACIVGTIRKLSFPQAQGTFTYIRYPLLLSVD
jgi:hypothetical protein